AMELTLSMIPKPGLAATVAMNREEMAKYVGIYSDPPGRAEILMRDGHLLLKEFGFTMLVNKTIDNRFFFTPPLSLQTEEITLIPGSNGRAEYLRRGSRTYTRVLADKHQRQ